MYAPFIAYTFFGFPWQHAAHTVHCNYIDMGHVVGRWRSVHGITVTAWSRPIPSKKKKIMVQALRGLDGGGGGASMAGRWWVRRGVRVGYSIVSLSSSPVIPGTAVVVAPPVVSNNGSSAAAGHHRDNQRCSTHSTTRPPLRLDGLTFSMYTPPFLFAFELASLCRSPRPPCNLVCFLMLNSSCL